MAKHPMKNHKQLFATLLLINDYIWKFYVPWLLQKKSFSNLNMALTHPMKKYK
jgi:hypothetical protein